MVLGVAWIMGCVWSREGMKKEEEMVLRVADNGLCLIERGNEEGERDGVESGG
jgi:hypothetical protein